MLRRPSQGASSLVGEEITDAATWNRTVASLPTGHLLQSYQWGAVKEYFGWRARRLVWRQEGQVRAAASVLHRALPFTGRSLLYVPKGPAFDPQDDEALRHVLADLCLLARRARALWLKIDPDIPLESEATLHLLREAGFCPSAEQVQLRNTMLVDLGGEEEDLLRRMTAEGRRNVRLAQRQGVEVRQGGLEDLRLFYDLSLETSQRQHFLLRPFSYYAVLWRRFLEADMATLLFARARGETLAGLMAFALGNKAWYLYGASRTVHRELRPNNLLQWEAMRWARARGCVSYDLWGVPELLEPGQPMWGLVQFKKSLGGQLQRWIGAYDYTPSPTLYALWGWLLPRYRRLIFRLKGLGDLPEGGPS